MLTERAGEVEHIGSIVTENVLYTALQASLRQKDKRMMRQYDYY